jgi:hypothetical protein
MKFDYFKNKIIQQIAECGANLRESLKYPNSENSNDERMYTETYEKKIAELIAELIVDSKSVPIHNETLRTIMQKYYAVYREDIISGNTLEEVIDTLKQCYFLDDDIDLDDVFFIKGNQVNIKKIVQFEEV